MTPHQRHLGDVDAYLAVLKPWLQCYRRAVVSCCALKTASGPVVLVAKIELRVVEDEQLHVVVGAVGTEHLTLSQAVFSVDADSVNSIVRGAFEGRLSGTDGTPKLVPAESSPLVSAVHPYRHPMLPAGARIPTALISGAPRHALVTAVTDSDAMDWELKAASVPFGSLAEALDYFGLPNFDRIGDMTRIEVLAESPAIIHGNSRLDGERLNLNVWSSAAIDRDRLRVGLKIYRDAAAGRAGTIDRRVFSLADARSGRLSEARVSLELEKQVGPARWIQAFLSLDSSALHEWYVTDPARGLNLRHVLHRSVDPSLENLKHLLFETRSSQAENFEQGVALLLNMLGFATALHGQAYGFKEGVDIVAQTPSGRVALVECTTGLPSNKDKLKKLALRHVELRRHLNEQGFNHVETLPIVVTPLTRAEVAADLPEAARLGIAVGTLEDLQGALDRAQLLPDPELLYNEVRNALQGSETGSGTP